MVSKDTEHQGKLETRAHLALYLLVVYGASLDHNDLKAMIADQIARLANAGDING